MRIKDRGVLRRIAELVRFRLKVITTYEATAWYWLLRLGKRPIGGAVPQFGCWHATAVDTVQIVAIQPWSLWFSSNARQSYSSRRDFAAVS